MGVERGGGPRGRELLQKHEALLVLEVSHGALQTRLQALQSTATASEEELTHTRHETVRPGRRASSGAWGGGYQPGNESE